MTSIAALILSIILALVPPAQAAPACVMSSGVNIPADLATAQAGPRCLELPAGVFSVAPTGGDYLAETAINVEIFGQGMGKTIIATQGVTLTGNLYIFASRAANTYIHDLTIQIGSGYSGNYEIGGVLIGEGAYRGRVERVEVVGGYAGNCCGGFGIGTYKSWNQGGGIQDTLIADSWVHDSPTTGLGVASNGNVIRHNRIERVGVGFLRHGMYIQGGNNLFEGNTILQSSGYSFHSYKQIPNIDGSGDRYIGNLSINPGAGHLVLNGTPNTANPAFPIGGPLTRNATISGNTFRNTAGHRSIGVWANGVPAVISGNTLEDIFVTTGAGWIDATAGGVVSDNILSTSGVAPDGAVNYAMIRATGTQGVIVANNWISNSFFGIGIRASGARHTIQGNMILNTATPGAEALNIQGDMLLVQNNRIESTGGGYTLAIGGALTNLTFSGNYLKRTGDLCNLNLAGVTGRFYNNMFDGTFRYSGAAPGLIQ